MTAPRTPTGPSGTDPRRTPVPGTTGTPITIDELKTYLVRQALASREFHEEMAEQLKLIVPVRPVFVVDLERHNDGETGLVGPFTSRENAETWVAITQPDDWQFKYIVIREVAAP